MLHSTYRDLLSKVKRWEESELSSQPAEKPQVAARQGRLAPLGAIGEGGPAQILKKQLEEAESEVKKWKERAKDLEGKATKALEKVNDVKREPVKQQVVKEKMSKEEEEEMKMVIN